MLKSITYPLGLLTLWSGSLVAQPTPRRVIRLDESIGLAVQNSKELRANAAEQSAAKARIEQARLAKGPGVTLNASYLRISDNIRPFSVSLPGAGDVVLNPQVLDQSFNSLAIRQLIWGGGRVRLGIEAARRDADALRLNAEPLRLTAADNVATIWQTLYVLNTSERALRQNVALLTERRRDVINLEKQGLVLPNDRLKLDLALSGLQHSLVELETGRNINQFNLAVALNVPTDTQFEIDTAEIEQGPAGTLADHLLEAVQHRSELKVLGVRREAALIGQKLVQTSRLPTLSWGGSYDYNRPNFREFPNRPAFRGTWQLGAFLTFDLSNLVTSKARETEIRYSLDRLDAGLGQLRDGVQMEVNAAWQNYQQARQKITLSETAIRQATENFRVEQNRLSAGATTLSDFLDANTQLLQAQLDLRAAKAAARLAAWKLQKSTGRVSF